MALDIAHGKSQGKGRAAGAAMWTLTALFTLRVVGQAVQRWLPQPGLPPFGEWQGSSISYPLLLAIQFVIVGAMACASYGAWKGTMFPRRRVMQWCAALGSLYMAASLARLAIGQWVAGAHPWFSARISGVFHVVLAAFVLALAGYHARATPKGAEQ